MAGPSRLSTALEESVGKPSLAAEIPDWGGCSPLTDIRDTLMMNPGDSESGNAEARVGLVTRERAD